MRLAPHRLSACSIVLALFVCAFWCSLAATQQTPVAPEVPPQFKLDMETAARLRPQLSGQSIEPLGRYATGRLVFDRLVEQI